MKFPDKSAARFWNRRFASIANEYANWAIGSRNTISPGFSLENFPLRLRDFSRPLKEIVVAALDQRRFSRNRVPVR
jgi:hypothetical protein